MNEAVVAGAIAGAVAGVIAGLAVLLVGSRILRQRGWQIRTFGTTSVFRRENVSGADAHSPQFGGRMQRVYTPSAPANVNAAGIFDRFDESGKRVVAAAQAEAVRANHNYIGTEHLLLGLLVADAGGPAGRALARHGVALDKARAALEFIVGRGDASVTPTEITLSPRTKKVLELSIAEAHRLGHPSAGAADILLGLIAEGQGIASGIIESLGVRLDTLRATVLEEQRIHHASGPFDRFNDRAKRVLALAQDEAIRMNHNHIAPEHVLLGLLRESEGVAGRVLASVGVDLYRARTEVEGLIGRGDNMTSPSEITLTPRTKKLIELAIDESRALAHGAIGTEHLLLAIVRDPGSNAAEVLRRLGLQVESIRQRVIDALGGAPPNP